MAPLQLYRVKQQFNETRLADIALSVREEMARISGEMPLFRPGMRIAIAVGSRGIANLSLIVKAIVDSLKEMSIAPFIVPAMGSHGGATAEGQREVLAGYGITEAEMGVPVQASMAVVELPRGDLPIPVYQDKIAHEADGIILVNRIKVHTDFHGTYESGLMKMAVIGLGKHEQAKAVHRYGTKGLREFIPLAARQILQYSRILMGIGIVENAYEQTMVIEAIRAEAIPEREPVLLERCRAHMPKLPVDRIDVLIVDRLGKEISGTGLDTNIIGRIRIPGEPEPATPDITRLIVCDLTEASHGNATGMGLADIVTERFRQKVDLAATNENIVTSTFLDRGKLPVVARTDLEAFQFAARTWGPLAVSDAAIIRIRDTLHLDVMYVSECVYQQIKDRPEITLMGGPTPVFDGKGNLTPFEA